MKIERTRDIATCLELRRIVFMDEQGVSESDEIDGLDDDAIHLLASVDGRPVGTARIVVSGEVAKIGRVCVLADQRGTGTGAALIEAALKIAGEVPGIRRAQLGAQTHAVAFYQRLGFQAFGPVYDDAGIPHRDMERTV